MGLEGARQLADRKRASGKQTGAVSILTVGNKTYKGESGKVNQKKLHPALRKALDDIAKTQVANGQQLEPWHGRCAEVDAINKALKDGANLDGAFIETLNANANVEGDKKVPHGKAKKACKTCNPILNRFNIISKTG